MANYAYFFCTIPAHSPKDVIYFLSGLRWRCFCAPPLSSSFVAFPLPWQEQRAWWRCCLTGNWRWRMWEILAGCCVTRMGMRSHCHMTTSPISSKSERGSRGQVGEDFDCTCAWIASVGVFWSSGLLNKVLIKLLKCNSSSGFIIYIFESRWLHQF